VRKGGAQCRAEAAVRIRQRMQKAVALLLIGIIAGLVGWIYQKQLNAQLNWFMVARPFMLSHVRPYVLKEEAERALKPRDTFRECATDCPEMIALPAGTFTMGSPNTEKDRRAHEGPQLKVTIGRQFAVSKFHVTFADWDRCVNVGGCPHVTDSGFGRGTKPIVNINWDEAKQYADWLSQMTGKRYRLLSEGEWEYAARAGTTTAYPWGDEIGIGNANCDGCGSRECEPENPHFLIQALRPRRGFRFEIGDSLA
jgi:formylglycine-generating enzyme required for sulfatase activity